MEPAKIPLATVKRVMKEDPDVVSVSNSAVQYMASSVQLFINYYTEKVLVNALSEGRQRIGYTDFANVANEHRELAFVGRLVPQQVQFKEAFAQRVAADMNDDEQQAIPFPRKEEEMEADEEDASD